MKKVYGILVGVALLSGCTHITPAEQFDLDQLAKGGIMLNSGEHSYKPTKSTALAGALNIIPGLGNFYLATGQGGDTRHVGFGLANLLLGIWVWPISAMWAIPEATIDAHRLNQKNMVIHYLFDTTTKQELANAGLKVRYGNFYIIEKPEVDINKEQITPEELFNDTSTDEQLQELKYTHDYNSNLNEEDKSDDDTSDKK